MIADVRARAAAHGRKLHYGIRLHVIVRETEDEAGGADRDHRQHTVARRLDQRIPDRMGDGRENDETVEQSRSHAPGLAAMDCPASIRRLRPYRHATAVHAASRGTKCPPPAQAVAVRPSCSRTRFTAGRAFMRA